MFSHRRTPDLRWSSLSISVAWWFGPLSHYLSYGNSNRLKNWDGRQSTFFWGDIFQNWLRSDKETIVNYVFYSCHLFIYLGCSLGMGGLLRREIGCAWFQCKLLVSSSTFDSLRSGYSQPQSQPMPSPNPEGQRSWMELSTPQSREVLFCLAEFRGWYPPGSGHSDFEVLQVGELF